MNKKYFGTDGIRGLVGHEPITPEFVMKLGWAAGKVFAKQGRGRILIGKDTRISGYMFESALEAGLSAAGMDVGLLGPIPTPGIAYLTRTFHAQAGIVISASHNPYYDNGIKFFAHDGTKLPDSTEQEIEMYLKQDIVCVDSSELGKAKRIDDASSRYIEFCKGSINHLNLQGLKIVLDCAHGATYQIAPAVFTELGANISVIGNQPDGLNINQNVGSTEPELLQKTVLQQQADLGIAFDGDGDRVMMVDHQGELVDGDQLLYIIASHAKQSGKLAGGVVGTLMSNLNLELKLKQQGIDFKRSQVGDRYVMQLLSQENWSYGGESSGHILCLNEHSTGDGIIAALQVLKALTESGKSLHQWQRSMQKMPQVMINVKRHKKVNLADNVAIQQGIQQGEKKLGEQGRILLRPSGTEPVVRVMVEANKQDMAQNVAEQLAQIVAQELS